FHLSFSMSCIPRSARSFMKVNCSSAGGGTETLCAHAEDDMHTMTANRDSRITMCLVLFLWQREPDTTTILSLSSINIQVSNRDFRRCSFVKNPKSLPDDRVILNFHSAPIAKNKNNRRCCVRRRGG